MNTPIILIWRWSDESIFKVNSVRRQNILDLEWTHSGHSARLGIDETGISNLRKGYKPIS